MENENKLPKLPERKFRKYFSERQKTPLEEISFETFRQRFNLIFRDFSQCGYFSEAFGGNCVDGDYLGTIGDHLDYFDSILGRLDLYPIGQKISSYSKEQIFDLIEILYDLISMPTDGTYHSYSECGWHFKQFSSEKGRIHFIEKINPLLLNFEGHQLNSEGQIIFTGNKHLSKLMQTEIPSDDINGVVVKIETAIQVYKSRQANLLQRKEAVRNLADVLEYLRPEAIKVLTKKDENDLFNIANNFGIRHHNKNQQTNYDESIWLSWMFYFYLSTIHAILRLIKKKQP